MLTIEQRQRWISELRSGNYIQQRQCTLRDENNRYCCLGVLADIVNPNLWEYMENMQEWHWAYKAAFPGIIAEHSEAILSQMNDTGSSFEEIADFIENHEEIQ